MSPIDALGWTATGVFAVSYFAREQRTLRLVQAGGALLWLGYGILLGAMPVVVANLIVATVALYSAVRERASRQMQDAGRREAQGRAA